MKTIDEVNAELKSLLAVDYSKLPPKEAVKAKSRIRFLRQCKTYLESKPREDFLEHESNRLHNRIKQSTAAIQAEINRLIKEAEGAPLPRGRIRSVQKELTSELNLPLLRSQLRTIRYLSNHRPL